MVLANEHPESSGLSQSTSATARFPATFEAAAAYLAGLLLASCIVRKIWHLLQQYQRRKLHLGEDRQGQERNSGNDIVVDEKQNPNDASSAFESLSRDSTLLQDYESPEPGDSTLIGGMLRLHGAEGDGSQNSHHRDALLNRMKTKVKYSKEDCSTKTIDAADTWAEERACTPKEHMDVFEDLARDMMPIFDPKVMVAGIGSQFDSESGDMHQDQFAGLDLLLL